MNGNKLQPAVARKYDLGTHHTLLQMGGRVINLYSLTLKEADDLVTAGNFPYLKKKEPKPRKKKQ